ncbi:hypothetical protein BS17DRAFT_479053 [Gyrodon lividus]|nr:hypothetical protein BS17DRAFT_479053 [Gyrodon lividus]
MPFEQYLRADDQDINNNTDHQNNGYPPLYNNFHDHGSRYEDTTFHHGDGHPHFPDFSGQYAVEHYHPPYPHAVQFQIPQFMFNGPPILAPGGGAEVLPAGLLDNPNSLATSSWFANNGCALFHSTLVSKQNTSHSTTSHSSNLDAHGASPAIGPHYSPPDFSSPFTLNVNPQEQPPPQIDVPTIYTSGLSHAPPAIVSPSTFPSSSAAQHGFSNALVANPIAPIPKTAPSALSLPVYSTSGFDIISILSRITNRPNPTIHLGPVDFSCSFAIVDVRRHDCPIVYASPTFYRLTGYSEHEVLGRNCRFLQSPTGHVAKGEMRRFASSEAVSYMRKSLSSSKECQTSLINYRKGGQAFINLVTVIPLRGGVHNTPEEADEVVYHIGFQVDLTEQPNRILEKLRDGSYYTNYSTWGTSGIPGLRGLGEGLGQALGQLQQAQNMASIGVRGGKYGQMMSIAVSKELRNLIADTTFTDSVSISTGTNISGTTGTAGGGSVEQGGNSTITLTTLTASGGVTSSAMNNETLAVRGSSTTGSMPVPLSPSLSLLLLELLPDFLLVLSLKGSFLYVAPSVRLVLGYEPHELVGRSISDVCHPADLVPLMRELKEGSVSGVGAAGTLSGDGDMATGVGPDTYPKPVDLLFRALPKTPTFSPFSQAQSSSTEHGGLQTHTQSVSSTLSHPSPLWNAHPTGSSGVSSVLDPSPCSTSPPPYVWLECRGRLHVEPGKGRKAIILSGRPRWMPVVRWGSIGKAGSVGSLQGQGAGSRGSSSMSAGSRSISNVGFGSGSTDPHEFWAFLSSQGTLLVTSASVRDVLGWGVGEVIGRSIWGMVGEGGSCVKELVEAELAKLDALKVNNTGDPPPTIVTTSLVHKDARSIPVRLVFYRTPWSHTHAHIQMQTSPTSPRVAITTPFIHPLNNPLCPLVCQVTILPAVEHQMNMDISLGGLPAVTAQMPLGADGPSPLMHPSSTSLFEELETVRGSSWQYELQQLKFANQRLHEELHALEGASAGAGAVASSAEANVGTMSGSGGLGSSSLGLTQSGSSTSSPLFPSSSALASVSSSHPHTQPHPQLLCTPLMHSTLSTSLSSSSHVPNGLHSQDPPSSDWSSLTGANGHGPNPLKRTWYSKDGPTM